MTNFMLIRTRYVTFFLVAVFLGCLYLGISVALTPTAPVTAPVTAPAETECPECPECPDVSLSDVSLSDVSEETLLAGRYHLRNRSSRFFKRSTVQYRWWG